MSNLVPAEEIEQIVGARRHAHQHLGRAVTSEETVYVLHSQRCKDSGIDLRECEWSWALDNGIDPADWRGFEDRPVVLAIIKDRLFPVVPRWLDTCVLPPADGREAKP
jgi:hypothetical protein